MLTRLVSSLRLAARAAGSALALVVVAGGCASHASGERVDTVTEGDPGRAERLLRADVLPDRFEVVALADRLAVAAVRERGAAAAAPAFLAARLRERLFRTVHADADGREAAALYERVLETAPPDDACRAALARAEILGELARDPGVTVRELASAQDRLDASCASALEALGATLAPYRERAGVSLSPRAQLAAVAPRTDSTSPPAASDEVVASPAPPPPSSEPVKITSIKPIGDVDSARVVLHVSGPTSFQGGTAGPAKNGAGPRVYVDVAKARLAKIKKEIPVGGLVERIRVAPHGDGARVVLDLARPAFRRIFYLPEPFRIVIDLSTRPEGRVTAPTKGAKRPLSRVVLDPGHGGNDPGATGPSGLHEKDVTLDVAHRAAPVLARELGVTTLLTRDTDEYVSLEERTARANAFGADVFVSIHCNASESGAARGVQTFVLDTTSDDVAARVAARENATSAQAGAEVSRLLSDLKLADLGSRSTHLAELLQRSAVASLAEKFPGAVDQGVKTAGFYVLVGAEMPAVLFETSFISNAVEEQRLASGDYRQRLADAVVNALRAYREGK